MMKIKLHMNDLVRFTMTVSRGVAGRCCAVVGGILVLHQKILLFNLSQEVPGNLREFTTFYSRRVGFSNQNFIFVPSNSSSNLNFFLFCRDYFFDIIFFSNRFE